jgi:hypothetical protein
LYPQCTLRVGAETLRVSAGRARPFCLQIEATATRERRYDPASDLARQTAFDAQGPVEILHVVLAEHRDIDPAIRTFIERHVVTAEDFHIHCAPIGHA